MSNGGVRGRERWKAALAPTDACATIEELSGFSDCSLPEPVNTRVSTHLAGCQRCQNELAMLKDFESGTPRPREEAAVNWITAQLERRSEQITGTTRDSLAHSRRNTGEERIHWWHRVFGLRPISAAALALATVMVIIAVGLHLRDAWEPAVSPDAGAGPTVLRSEELAIVGPTGDLDQAPSELRWQAASNAVIYSVQLMEVDRTELWKAESSQTSVSLPPAVRARIVPGKPLLWQVTAKDAAGRIIAASQIQRFHVTIKALQRKD